MHLAGVAVLGERLNEDIQEAEGEGFEMTQGTVDVVQDPARIVITLWFEKEEDEYSGDKFDLETAWDKVKQDMAGNFERLFPGVLEKEEEIEQSIAQQRAARARRRTKGDER